MVNRILILCFAGLLSQLAIAGDTSAQDTGKNITRIVVATVDSPENKTITIVDKVHFQPNTSLAAHTHPGLEVLCIVNGQLTLTANKSDKVYKSNDCIANPAGMIHSGKSGPNGVDIIATYVINRGELIINFKNIDKNGDGKVAAAEAKAAGVSDADFKKADTNGDGNLSVDEYLNVR